MEYAVADLKTYLGGKADYYQKQWKRLDQGKVSVNFTAAVFPFFWLIYRKQYRWLVLPLSVFLAGRVLYWLAQYTGDTGTYLFPALLINLAHFLFFLVYANRLIRRSFARDRTAGQVAQGGILRNRVAVFCTCLFLCLAVDFVLFSCFFSLANTKQIRTTLPGGSGLKLFRLNNPNAPTKLYTVSAVKLQAENKIVVIALDKGFNVRWEKLYTSLSMQFSAALDSADNLVLYLDLGPPVFLRLSPEGTEKTRQTLPLTLAYPEVSATGGGVRITGLAAEARIFYSYVVLADGALRASAFPFVVVCDRVIEGRVGPASAWFWLKAEPGGVTLSWYEAGEIQRTVLEVEDFPTFVPQAADKLVLGGLKNNFYWLHDRTMLCFSRAGRLVSVFDLVSGDTIVSADRKALFEGIEEVKQENGKVIEITLRGKKFVGSEIEKNWEREPQLHQYMQYFYRAVKVFAYDFYLDSSGHLYVLGTADDIITVHIFNDTLQLLERRLYPILGNFIIGDAAISAADNKLDFLFSGMSSPVNYRPADFVFQTDMGGNPRAVRELGECFNFIEYINREYINPEG